MPWVVEGQAGEVVRWVKNFITGQWLCNRLGAEGSGCTHSLAARRATPVKHELVHGRSDWPDNLKPERGVVYDDKGGVTLKKKLSPIELDQQSEDHKKTCNHQCSMDYLSLWGEGLEGGNTNPGVGLTTRFWDQEEASGHSPAADGGSLSISDSIFRPGGRLHYLAPFVASSPHRQKKYGTRPSEVSAITEVRASSGDAVRRSRRRARALSPFLTVSFSPNDERTESNETPSDGMPSSRGEKSGSSAIGSPLSNRQQVSVVSPNTENVRQPKGGGGERFSSSESPSHRSTAKKEGPTGTTFPLRAVSASRSESTPALGATANQSKPFRIPNPLEAVVGFVEDVRDLVNAAAGKKRPPSKESVAAWEEKALAKSLLRKKHASLVMFYSKKCQLCKSMTPMVNEMARKESWWLDVCYVDVDNQNWMPEVVHYDVTYVPCFMYVTPSGMAIAKTGAPLSKTHVLDGLQKVMSGAHPECKLARRRLAEKVRKRQKEAYAKAKAEWEERKRLKAEEEKSAEGTSPLKSEEVSEGK